MTLKAVLFDMDDTLIDWSMVKTNWEDNARSHMSAVFKYVNDTLHPLEDEAAFFQQMWSRILNDWTSARETLIAPHVGRTMVDVLEALGIPRERLVMEDLLEAHPWGPYPGVVPFEDAIEVLPDLRAHGIKIGLVTNSAQPIGLRERELVAYGFGEWIDDACRITAADVGYLKPHPNIFNRALEQIGATPEEAVFVGDSVQADIVGARRVGMKAVLRRLPYRKAEQDQAISETTMPDAQIETFYELYDVFDEWYPGWRKK